MYRVPVEFTVRKTNKDPKAFSSGFLDVKIEDNVMYNDFRSMVRKKYLLGLKPLRRLSFYDFDVVLEDNGRKYYVVNEDCWKDLRDDAIAGRKTLQLDIYGQKIMDPIKRGDAKKKIRVRRKKESTLDNEKLQETLKKKMALVRTEEQTVKMEKMRERMSLSLKYLYPICPFKQGQYQHAKVGWTCKWKE